MPDPRTNRPAWPTWLLSGFVVAVTFIAFIPCLNNQFLTWDDNTNFTDNPSWRGLAPRHISWMFSSFQNGHYQPITWLTLGLDHNITRWLFPDDPSHGPGMDPRLYHLTNIFFHAVNAALVYLLALRLIACAIMHNSTVRTSAIHVAAALAAVLWAVHPMRVENVAWITERRDVVSGCLLLLTVLAYLRAANLTGPSRWRWITLSFFLYTLSLMAKVAGAPLPVAVLVLDWYPLRRLRGSSNASVQSVWLEKIPFFIAAAAFSYIASRGQAGNEWLYPLSIHPLNARIVVSFYGLMFYAWKTVWPANLLPLYELQLPLPLSQPRFMAAIALVGLTTIVLIVLIIKRRFLGVVVAAICYAVFLGPVLGLVQNGPQIVADRYAYLPAIGLMILLAGGAASWLTHSASPRAGIATIVLVCGISIVLASLTWRQCRVWRTTETLWTIQLERDPNCSIANYNLGTYLGQYQRKPDQAIPYLLKAVEHAPANTRYRENLREALRQTGNLSELIQTWLEEAALFGSEPSFRYTATYHYDEGIKALKANQDRRAIEHFSVSAALDPTRATTINNIAMICDRLQQAGEAANAYRRAIQLDPKLPQARYGLALLLSRQGKNSEAITVLQDFLKVSPNDSYAAQLLSQLQQSKPSQ